ncbi:MAG: hypothetical protein WCV92_04290 [Candidatus Buchananbacteria bacterium]
MPASKNINKIKTPKKLEANSKKVEPIKHSNAPAIVMAVVVVIIIIMAICFYVLDKPTGSINNVQEQSNSNANYQVPLGVDIPGKALDPYAGWNYFKNSSNTYEFKYPKNWQVKARGQDAQLIYPDVTSTQILVSYQLVDKKLSDYLSQLDKTALTAFEGKPSVKIEEEKAITVNGFSAITRLQHLNAADLDQKITYIYNNGRVLTFSMIGQLSSDWIDAYNLILPSFNFVTASSTVSTTSSSSIGLASTTVNAVSSLVPYKNAAYNFEIKYSSTLKPKTETNGIAFDMGSDQYLKIQGFNSSMPSLINYHPNGANVAGQSVIGGKDAMKFSLTKKDGDEAINYVQYVLVLNNSKWLKIEYQGSKSNSELFDKIISSIKF